MKKLNDINDITDTRLLVDEFYTKVRADALLQEIFNLKIGDRWQEHLEKMYQFWETVLLDKHTYHGSPFPPHAQLAINKEHFERWILLFNSTVDAHFIGERAERAKWQAHRMAELFEHKINYYREGNSKPLI